MINILIVEDSPEKLKQLTKSIISIEELSLSNIDHVIDSHNAKIKLRTKYYDILILDVAIPRRIDQDVKKSEGLNLLQEILKRDIYYKPLNIIGITQFPDVYETVKDKFKQKLITIIHFDPASQIPLDNIKEKIQTVMDAKISSKSKVDEYFSHSAIITAIHKPEFESVLSNGWKWKKIRIVGDDNPYYKTEIKSKSGSKIVYSACCNRVGLTASAILATKIISHFRPQFIAMCGISAGVKDQTKMGDVIVSDPVWDWGSGKWVISNKKIKFLPGPHQLPLDPSIKSKFLELSTDHEKLFSIRKSFKGKAPDYDLSVKIGPLASGAAVLSDGEIIQKIKSQHRKLLGIEMETYAVFSAAYEATHPKPKVFSAKSVVDFADDSKDDTYHDYASFTSTEIVKIMVEEYL